MCNEIWIRRGDNGDFIVVDANFIFLSFFFKNVYLFLRERETECEWGKGRVRERHRIRSRLQALSCQHRAWGGARTHEWWDHDLSWNRTLNWLSHPGAPLLYFYKSSALFRNTIKVLGNSLIISSLAFQVGGSFPGSGTFLTQSTPLSTWGGPSLGLLSSQVSVLLSLP